MKTFLATLLECSAAMSVISLLYIVALPLLSKRYSAKWLYYIWLVVVIGWVFPFRPHLNTNLFLIQIPKIPVIQTKYIDVGEPLTIITNGERGASSIPLWLIIASVWALCTVGIIAYNTWKHRRFLKMVNRWSEDITDLRILDVLDSLRTDMKIRAHVGLKACPAITSPMMIGFFRPIILIPSIQIDSDELTFILSHELVHLKRNDLWYKVLVLLAIAIHWFNPVVYFMAKAIAVQCEISCDEQLVKETSLQQRQQYGETIIGVIRKGVKLRTALSTNFYIEGNFIKTRIFYIMDTTKKKAGITILCAALTAIVGSGMTFAPSSNRNQNGDILLQSELDFFGVSKNKQVINIDIETMEGGKYVCFGGPYILEGGDIIQYNITTEGNKGNLKMKFLREDSKTRDGNSLQGLTMISSCISNSGHQVKIAQSQAGSYCLLIGNDGEEIPSNIKGTIEITKGKERGQHG